MSSTALSSKQSVLKPQDLLIAVKIAISSANGFTYSQLSQELFISPSEAHAAVGRAERSHLVIRDGVDFYPAETALLEFVVHGVQYAFPGIVGGYTRGLPTSASADPLKSMFTQLGITPLVWPDPDGEVRGIALTPLYPTVPRAARKDQKLYQALVLIDAIRVGSAREREIAREEFTRTLL